MSAAEFIAAARTLKGARWRHLGRKMWAVDCIGLLAVAFKKCRVKFEDVRLYPKEPESGRLQAECVKRWGAPLPRSQAQPGDIAVIRWGPGRPSHVGIIGNHPYGGLTLIHAHNIQGVIEQSLSGSILAIVQEVYRPWSDA